MEKKVTLTCPSSGSLTRVTLASKVRPESSKRRVTWAPAYRLSVWSWPTLQLKYQPEPVMILPRVEELAAAFWPARLSSPLGVRPSRASTVKIPS